MRILVSKVDQPATVRNKHHKQTCVSHCSTVAAAQISRVRWCDSAFVVCAGWCFGTLQHQKSDTVTVVMGFSFENPIFDASLSQRSLA